MSEEEIDPEILAVFLDETSEALAALDARFVDLEQDQNDRQSLDAIFRVVHTIKGNAAFFGLLRTKRLAHVMEDLLSSMRETQAPVTKGAVSLLLQGIDLVRTMLGSVREGEAELAAVDKAEIERLIEALGEQLKTADGPGLAPILAALDRILTGPADVQAMREGLKVLRGRVLDLHRESSDGPERAGEPEPPGPAALAAELVRVLAQAPAEEPTAEDAARISALTAALCEGLSGPDQAAAQQMKAEIDRVVPAAGFIGLLREELLSRARTLQIVQHAHSAPAPRPVGPAQSGKGARGDGAARTMRVDESKVDQFLDYVGELILVREMFVNVGKRVREETQSGNLSSEYQRALEAFTLLSHSLQDSIMAVRRVSIKVALQKVPRLARDLAETRRKEVKVEISGEMVAVDKSLLESVEGPLAHMVRNAVDHGIESADVREAAGKPRQGTLTVTADEEADYIRIEVRDDGGGINAEKLKNKALRLGLITGQHAARMPEQEAFELLFAPGLSTAEEVTDISGRGVGMDVVRRNVLDVGGEIKIRSEFGQGTTFTLLLPKSVTVQILDGFLVRVADQRFVLPLQAIKESFRPEADQLVTVAERGEFISRRGQVLPLMRFGDVLRVGRRGTRADVTDAIVVAVDVSGAGCAGLLVDEVLGVQQVVLREVHGIDVGGAPFAGGAVLGDGRVAMVVDVDRLRNLV